VLILDSWQAVEDPEEGEQWCVVDRGSVGLFGIEAGFVRRLPVNRGKACDQLVSVSGARSRPAGVRMIPCISL